jgi:hypothetical protein
MGGLADYVVSLAREIADASQNKAERLKSQLHELQKQEAKIQRELELAQSAAQRLVNFDPSINGHIQCPDCWMNRAQHVSMRNVPAEPGDHRDIFECRVCHFELAL